MPALPVRLHHFLSALALAVVVTAPPGMSHAQGFSSVSSPAPRAASASPPGATTDATSVPVATVSPPAVGASNRAAFPTHPAKRADSRQRPAAAPALWRLAGYCGTHRILAARERGHRIAGDPGADCHRSRPHSPVGAASSAFSSGSGSFGSVSGGAPALPAAPPANASYGAGSSASFEMAEKVVVIKHERVLHLLRRGQVIAEYPIKLGLNPYGHKQREGDFRTPEGKYELVARNSRATSSFRSRSRTRTAKTRRSRTKAATRRAG